MHLFNKQYVRILLVILVLLGAALAFVPRIWSYQTVDGIVNGHVLTITSPIEGIIHTDTSIAVGSSVKIDQNIGIVDNILLDRSFENELQTELSTLESRIRALTESNTKMSEMYDRLSTQTDQYQTHRLLELQSQRQSAEYDVERLVHELEYQTRSSERINQLAVKRYSSDQDTDESVFRVNAIQAELNAARKQLDAIDTNISAVQNRSFLDSGNNDLPYSQQRADEILLRILQQSAQITEDSSRIEKIRSQLLIEQNRLDRNISYPIVSPVNGFIWRSYVHDGAVVAIGNELLKILDCESTFLDVLVNERLFNNVSIGDTVRYRYRNEYVTRTGTITDVQGPAVIKDDRTLAASVPDQSNTRKNYTRVLIQPDHRSTDATTRCDVGRRVIVNATK